MISTEGMHKDDDKQKHSALDQVAYNNFHNDRL